MTRNNQRWVHRVQRGKGADCYMIDRSGQFYRAVIALGMALAGTCNVIMFYRMGNVAKREQHRDEKYDGRVRFHSITHHGVGMLGEGPGQIKHICAPDRRHNCPLSMARMPGITGDNFCCPNSFLLCTSLEPKASFWRGCPDMANCDMAPPRG